jgi:hypothetical protein
MKIIYTIYLSEDGLHHKAYSNKKALCTAISEISNYQECRTIDTFTRKNGDLKFISKPFNYANLVKALSITDEVSINDGSFNSSVIRIQAVELSSK